MKKVILAILSLISLCPLWAQDEASSSALPLDTVAADSLAADSLHISAALLQSWQRCYPWVKVPYGTLYRAAEQMEVEGCAEVDSLHLLVDALPFDSSLVYAQSDLRLPIIIDAMTLPAASKTLVETLNERLTEDRSSQAARLMQLPANRFAGQLAFGAERRQAVGNFAARHLNRVGMLRVGNTGNTPFERRSIERKEFETTDLVVADAVLDLGDAQLDIEQVTFHADKWHRRGSTSLQVAQTALSSNWYKGGDNNMTMSTYDKLAFSRYDESMKTTFDITLELRLSGYYTAADTINPVRVNDNQFRVDVSYGYKAWKNWYYSTSFYAKTPLLDFHQANSKVTKSTFLSPLETNLSVGLDYKKQSADKRINFNLMLAPLSYSMTSVSSDRVNVTQFGIDADEHSLHQFGSSVTAKIDWKITDMVQWSSRFYYFTTYKQVLLEFENTVNVQLGKYSSAKFYYYPRFDDGRDDHFECKQMLTFGLSFNW